MKIREIEDYGLKILTEKAKDGSMTVYAKFAEAEKRNQNFRIYPHKILSREVNRVQAKIASGQFLGQADHSDSAATFLKDVSHVVTKLEMKGNEGYATIRILNTDAGKNCQEIIRGKGRIGISTRSVGTVDAKTGLVQSDLQLLALDLVANPSVKDATIGRENILEGLEFEENTEDTQKQKDLEEAVSDLETQSYLNAIEEGFQGTQDDWEKIHGGGLRRMMGLKEDDGKTSVQKLTEEQVKDRTWRYFEEACRAGFIGSFEQWKEAYPRLFETASKGIKIEEKAKSKEPEKYKITWQEAVASGFTGTIAEYRKQYPDIELILPAPAQKPIKETLGEEAERIFTALKKDNTNSAVTLESVRQMLEKEEIVKSDKRLRKRAIAIISRECDGSMSQEELEKMVEQEVKNLKEERRVRKEKNWQAYKRLLDD